MAGITAKLRARKKRQKHLAAKPVYAYVTRRDVLCRACHSRPTTQRHHLAGRGVPETKHNVCGVCDEDHDLLHVRIGGKRLKLSGDAEGKLTIERRIMDTWFTVQEP